MAFEVLVVCVFGLGDRERARAITLPDALSLEADHFELHSFDDDSDLPRILVDIRPQVLVSFGSEDDFQQLRAAPIEVRRRWIHFANADIEPQVVAERIMQAFVVDVATTRFADIPLVSVFTPTYKTGKRIDRPLQSLLQQSYENWEWIIYDDSPDDGQTFREMQALCERDHRIKAFRADRPCGIIGEVKRRACGLSRGEILLELDHDDALTLNAIADVVECQQLFPDAGFFYSDCAEIFSDGENAVYDDGYAFGYGSYRSQTYAGHSYAVTNYPDVNAKTIRHIVGIPNHLRAWTRAGYAAAGGHHPHVHVCDDYELCLRTFLKTRMVHIRRFGYIQYHDRAGSTNTQRVRNQEIQRLTRYFMLRYNQAIHDRFVELGVEDFIWREGGSLDFDTPNPPLTPIANYVYD
ncbi:MAG TPA: glycosyltransferase [Polyangiaceae bacterium]|nr:glycosyltransferase [Polyangiaceae bacterium]